jgi:hypothetical protein
MGATQAVREDRYSGVRPVRRTNQKRTAHPARTTPVATR